MADSSLFAIKKKTRLLTRSLTEAQLSDYDLTQYINTYVLYDFPETLRLFNLKTTFTFYTLPYIDTYSTTDNPDSALYNFTNKYITTDRPVYIAGYQAMFSQSREQFYGIYPILNSIANIGTTGDGITTQFGGFINTTQADTNGISGQIATLLQNNVLFSAVDDNSNGLAMADSPILDATTGNPTIWGQLYNALDANTPPTLFLNAPYASQGGFPVNNYINYLTGEYVVTFADAPDIGSTINSQTVAVNPSLPQALLFFDGEFVVRPVPDQSYRVDMEVFTQPSELLASDSVPELSEWWQLIAFNAAKKILEDRLDYDTLNLILPSLKEQENLVLRRTIVQQTSQRTSTIYTEQTANNGYGNGFFNGGNLF